jgi:hypothetical protein
LQKNPSLQYKLNMVRFIEKEKGHSPIHGKYAKEEEKKT